MGAKLFYPKGSYTSIFIQQMRKKKTPQQTFWHLPLFYGAFIRDTITAENTNGYETHLYFILRKKGSVMKEQKNTEYFHHVTSVQAQGSNLLCRRRSLMQAGSTHVFRSTVTVLLLLASSDGGHMQPLWKARPYFLQGPCQQLLRKGMPTHLMSRIQLGS